MKHGLLLIDYLPYGNLISDKIKKNSSKLSPCQYYCMIAPVGL